MQGNPEEDILKVRESVMQYINFSKECEWLDFKSSFYNFAKKGDIIKDIVSLANNHNEKDKYIIFGVEDKTQNICGIEPNTLIDVATFDELLYEKVEPHIAIMLDSFEIDEKLIAYIVIPNSNHNRPYVIKNDCQSVKKGDIYIRKGTANLKATRRDIDDFYHNRAIQTMSPYGDIISIEPIHIEGSIIGNPTYGMIDIEITNLSNNPMLINKGWIEFENVYGTITRSIYGILPHKNIKDYPLEIEPNSHFVKTFLFDFHSRDCVELHFNEEGFLTTDTCIKTCFKDVNHKHFESDQKKFFVSAKGDILYKIKRKYKDFRQYLIKNKKVIIKAIEYKENKNLEQLFADSSLDFSLIEPIYVLGNSRFLEYDICAEIIRVANNADNDYVIILMTNKGLRQDFVDFVLGK